MRAEAIQRIETEWLGLRGVAKYANVSERTLRSWIHSRTDPLPAVQVSGKILVRRSELDTWLARHPVRKSDAAVDLDGLVTGVLKGLAHGR